MTATTAATVPCAANPGRPLVHTGGPCDCFGARKNTPAHAPAALPVLRLPAPRPPRPGS